MNRIVLVEQDSPRYSGDYPVHRGLSCSREQDYKLKSPVNRIVAMNTMDMASVNMQNSRREQDSRL